MMQAPEPAKRSPWGLRIAVVGGAMLLLGVILMSTQSETIGSVMDPREQHHDEPYIGTGTFWSEQPTCVNVSHWFKVFFAKPVSEV